MTQIKRSAGQSAVAAAAYRAGEKLHSEYYGEDSDYTRKGGVICSDILLPSHAPPEYADRQTLWNAVEKAERGKKAQLAYSFDIALQNEFSMQENIDLARQFLLDNFVNRGMVADFAVHQPDKENGGISNPHFHVMCPIRPIEPDGRWGKKQRREYVLDKHGERILDEAGNYVFNAVPTTDWSKPETLEEWRQAWAEMCNAKFAEKGLDCRIDHRSFERQGVEQIPTQHEGPTVRAMEAKGIRTDKGDLNRFIRKTNALLREAKEKIAALIGWLKDVKAELAKPQPPMLNDLLALHCANRNKGAYSNKAKNANLQRYAEAFSFLQSKKLYTVDDLESTLYAMQNKIDTLKKSASAKQARIKEVDELLRMVDYQHMERYCFRVLLDYYRLLCRWKEDYAPQTPEDGYHPRFVEALQKLSLIAYLLDELLGGDMQARASVVIEYGEEVRKLEQRMAELAAADEAAAQNAGGQYSAADEH